MAYNPNTGQWEFDDQPEVPQSYETIQVRDIYGNPVASNAPQQIAPMPVPLPVQQQQMQPMQLDAGKIRYTPTGNIAMDNAVQRMQNAQPGWGAQGPQLAMQMAAGLPVGNQPQMAPLPMQGGGAAMQMAQQVGLPGNLRPDQIRHSPYFQQKALDTMQVQHQAAMMPLIQQNMLAAAQQHKDARFSSMVSKVGSAFAPMLVTNPEGKSEAKIGDVIKYHIDPQAELIAQHTGVPLPIVRSALIKELQSATFQMQSDADKQILEREKLNKPIWDAEQGRAVFMPSAQNPQGGSIAVPGMQPRLTGEAQEIESLRRMFYPNESPERGQQLAQTHYFQNKKSGAEATRSPQGLSGDAAEVDSWRRVMQLGDGPDSMSAAAKSLSDYKQKMAEANRRGAMSPGINKITAENESFVKELQGVQDYYSKHLKQGKDLIGPKGTGLATNLKATWMDSPVEAGFVAKLQSVRAMLINKLAGAAIGPTEAKLYLATLPSEQDTTPLFKEHIATTQRHFQSLNDIILAREKSRMVDSHGNQVPEDLSGQINMLNSVVAPR